MNKEFDVQILTPSKALFRGKATEVVLPSYDGEVGVLEGHADFVGLLGTGALKMVTGGNDHWYMLSSGVYQVEDGKLTILAEQGETPQPGIDIAVLSQELKVLSEKLADFKSFTPEEYPKWKVEHDRIKARIDIHRRTEIVN